MAITAWSAKVVANSICFVLKPAKKRVEVLAAVVQKGRVSARALSELGSSDPSLLRGYGGHYAAHRTKLLLKGNNHHLSSSGITCRQASNST
jgi:hypothetical protein